MSRELDKRRGSGSGRTIFQREARPFDSCDPHIYDEDWRCMPGRYRRARIIKNSYVLETLDRCAKRAIIVDFGAGTANDALAILPRAPGVLYIGIERSTPMWRHAREKLRKHGLEYRSILLRHDFQMVQVAEIEECLAHAGYSGPIEVVLSTFALHHLTLKDKTMVYRLASRLLGKSGRFVLTDLFAHDSVDCSRAALRKEVMDVRRMVRKREKEDRASVARSTISEEHYVNWNRTISLRKEMAVLQRVGFAFADTVYRDGQLAIVIAGKAR